MSFGEPAHVLLRLTYYWCHDNQQITKEGDGLSLRGGPGEPSGVERQARREGRDPAEHVARLLRLAMLVEDLPLAEIGRFAGVLRQLVEARNRTADAVCPARMLTDPATGLPVIISPPDASVHSMSPDAILTLERSILEEEEFQRAGVPL